MGAFKRSGAAGDLLPPGVKALSDCTEPSSGGFFAHDQTIWLTIARGKQDKDYDAIGRTGSATRGQPGRG